MKLLFPLIGVWALVNVCCDQQRAGPADDVAGKTTSAPASRPTKGESSETVIELRPGDSVRTKASGNLTFVSFTNAGDAAMRSDSTLGGDFVGFKRSTVYLSLRETVHFIEVDAAAGYIRVRLRYPAPARNPFGF